MKSTLLYVGSQPIDSWLKSYNNEILDLGIQFNLIHETKLEAAYDHLFSIPIGVLVLDSNIEGADEALSMIKAEDMVKQIQVMVIDIDSCVEVKKRFYGVGAEQVVSLDNLDAELFMIVLRPLILNNKFLNEQILDTSNLKEEAISDFIILDVVKKYVSRTIWNVAKECAKNQKLDVKEVETEATVVFGDIKGFTKMSENLEPRDVIGFLNVVYEVVTRHIYDNGGDVDKFIGDAFYGIFQSPRDAVRAMVLVQKEIELQNEARLSEKRLPIEFRIGVHTGPVIRGNVGAHNRFDHTMIGDTVNTASRLEHIAPVGDILISTETKEKAKLNLTTSETWGEVLRGRHEEIQVYKVYNELKENAEFLAEKSQNIIAD